MTLSFYGSVRLLVMSAMWALLAIMIAVTLPDLLRGGMLFDSAKPLFMIAFMVWVSVKSYASAIKRAVFSLSCGSTGVLLGVYFHTFGSL